MSERNSKQKGKILESRFIELISIGSSGRLSCFIPDVDDDGIDVIVNPKGSYKPIFLQVKSRFKLNRGRFSTNIGTNTFREDEKFFIIFFYYNKEKFEIENIWLIPSIEFKEKSMKINLKNHRQTLRFSANPNRESQDKWSKYKINKKELAKRIESIIRDLYE